MPAGTGLDAQLGFTKESVYGTRVVPAKFLEFRSESLKLDKNYIMSKQLGAGSTFQSSTRRTATTKGVTGAISLEVPSKGFSSLVDLLHPNVVTPVIQGAGPAYLHTHDIGLGTPTKSATIQVGRPSTDGTVRPFDYLGCMPTEWSLVWSENDFLLFNCSYDGRDESTAQSLATRVIPSGIENFVFTQGALLIGGATVADVGGGQINGGRPLNVTRHYLGGAGLKAKPLQNDFAAGGGSLMADFLDLTHYNRFINGTIAALVLTFTGTLLNATFYNTVKVTLGACGFDGETPNVGSMDIIQQNIPFLALNNGVDSPIKIEVTTTDVTV